MSKDHALMSYSYSLTHKQSLYNDIEQKNQCNQNHHIRFLTCKEKHLHQTQPKIYAQSVLNINKNTYFSRNGLQNVSTMNPLELLISRANLVHHRMFCLPLLIQTKYQLTVFFREPHPPSQH